MRRLLLALVPALAAAAAAGGTGSGHRGAAGAPPALRAIDRTKVDEWVAGYERAWRTAGTGPLRDLFTEDASYRMSPYEEPFVGVDRIGEIWEAERKGPDEVFDMSPEIVAVDGDTAVVRVEVAYGDPVDREYRDLWVIRFAEDGRAAAFEEWPFWPGQPFSAKRR